jgi:hypothetical protein
LVWVHQTKMGTYLGFIFTNVVMHPCDKFHTIWTKIDQKGVHGCLSGMTVELHTRSLPLVLWYSAHFSCMIFFIRLIIHTVTKTQSFTAIHPLFHFFKFKVLCQT